MSARPSLPADAKSSYPRALPGSGDLRIDTSVPVSNWSWRIKVQRILWAPFGLIFLPGTTRYLSALRVLSLKLFGARIQTPVLIRDGVKIWYPWNLTMGRHAEIGTGAEIYNFAPVTIGAQAWVSQRCYVCTASHDYRRRTMPLIYSPIVIGDQAWLAAGSFIGPGVTIGQGAVVGAHAVVTRDVPAWTVVAGNPARHIKDRTVES
jgi:putative colanic acid biosynthesis acetyltransferase WcaF